MEDLELYHYVDYERCENLIEKLGYRTHVTNRTPSALCGDGTCRFRYILIGIRNDISTVGINLREHLSDFVQPMAPLLDHIDDIPDNLWLDPQGFIPRTSPANRSGTWPSIDDVVGAQNWGSTTYAEVIGWHSGYGKGYHVRFQAH